MAYTGQKSINQREPEIVLLSNHVILNNHYHFHYYFLSLFFFIN